MGCFQSADCQASVPTLRGWTNDKMKSKEEQEFEVYFGKCALEDRLHEIEMPDEAQAVHKEVPSNATPKCTIEAEYDTVRSKITGCDPLR